MKVAELIKILEKMPQDAEVHYFDTYWESEGYGKDAHEPSWIPVYGADYDEEENLVGLS